MGNEKRKPVEQFVDTTPVRFRPRRYRQKTMNIFYLSANGLPAERIAEMVSVKLARVQRILGSNRGRGEVGSQMLKISGENPQKMFENLVPETVVTQRDIMRDRSAKPSTRLAATIAIQERALGKPKQQVEINHKSGLRQLLEEIRQEKEPAALDAQFRNISDPGSEPELIEPRRSLPAPEREKDDVDKWIEENL